MHRPREKFVAIACGGTGGHLFPGIAIAEKLAERGYDAALLVSEKEIDQVGSRGLAGMDVVRLPAVPLLKGNFGQFGKSFWSSFKIMRGYFRSRPPAAVLAMGGFTSAAPILAGKLAGARTALHEANSYAGRANRLLAPWVDHVFIGFSSATNQLSNRSICFTGTPVREQFQPAHPGACRMALGLNPEDPVLLVMGGSQGASAINRAMIEALPLLSAKVPELQYLHLTGAADYQKVAAAYKSAGVPAKVQPFLTEMELALGAATLALTRAGASSLAELAAMQIPSILIPYPHAADDHQHYNARALAQAGAARMLVQSQLRSDVLVNAIVPIVSDPYIQEQMRTELMKWHYPKAAQMIVDAILNENDRETVGTQARAVTLHAG